MRVVPVTSSSVSVTVRCGQCDSCKPSAGRVTVETGDSFQSYFVGLLSTNQEYSLYRVQNDHPILMAKIVH